MVAKQPLGAAEKRASQQHDNNWWSFHMEYANKNELLTEERLYKLCRPIVIMNSHRGLTSHVDHYRLSCRISSQRRKRV